MISGTKGPQKGERSAGIGRVEVLKRGREWPWRRLLDHGRLKLTLVKETPSGGLL